MSEFKGKAGVIYTEYADTVDGFQWQVWFEDFCIIGTGNTELKALGDAERHVSDISALISEAIETLMQSTTAASGGGGWGWG